MNNYNLSGTTKVSTVMDHSHVYFKRRFIRVKEDLLKNRLLSHFFQEPHKSGRTRKKGFYQKGKGMGLTFLLRISCGARSDLSGYLIYRNIIHFGKSKCKINFSVKNNGLKCCLHGWDEAETNYIKST